MYKYLIKGQLFEAVKCGDKGDFFEGWDKSRCCTDCGVKVGKVHRMDCDCERCPNCGCQLITCECEPEKVFIPEVGDELTYNVGSDSYPYEIVEVISDKHLEIRALDAKIISGSVQTDNAEYEYSSNIQGRLMRVKKYSDGWYKTTFTDTGREIKCHNYKMSLSFGEAYKYLDPSF